MRPSDALIHTWGRSSTSTRSLSAFEGSMFWSSDSKNKNKGEAKEEEASSTAEAEVSAKEEVKEDRSAAEAELQEELDGVKAEGLKLKDQVSLSPQEMPFCRKMGCIMPECQMHECRDCEMHNAFQKSSHSRNAMTVIG